MKPRKKKRHNGEKTKRIMEKKIFFLVLPNSIKDGFEIDLKQRFRIFLQYNNGFEETHEFVEGDIRVIF